MAGPEAVPGLAVTVRVTATELEGLESLDRASRQALVSNAASLSTQLTSIGVCHDSQGPA